MTRRRRACVDLDFACRMEVVSPVEGAAESLGAAFGLAASACHFLGLAVREAVTNAIRHGCPDARGRIRVRMQVSDQTLVVTVRDPGYGFDPTQVPDPSLPGNLKKGSGRGIFYMRMFCDDLSFSFPTSGGTVVRLEKRWALQ